LCCGVNLCSAALQWGSGSFGQTGLGAEANADSVVPQRIDALSSLHVAQLASSGSATSSAALTADGVRVVCEVELNCVLRSMF
jgi:alpha-tubulin suppressor-like RCC1 family protein